MNARTNENPDALESEVEATRSRMNETIDAIERKLTPGEMMNESLDYFRHSGSGEFLTNLRESAKNNPMPAVLTGIGIGWLMLANRSSGTGRATARAGELKDEMKGKAGAAADRTREAAHNAKERVHDARERMHRAREETRDLGRRASGSMRDAADQVSRVMHEQPLIVGALGIALGAALAAGLPRTSTEDKLMGGIRDEAMDKATEAGQERAEQAEATAHAAAEAAREQADREGLMPGH
ncbi:MAG TPA: DUF3618 domain-containing protein [Gammaproteobacteria bacterium]|nr:DUF3618 domain-containing protein [Gammaproteobacteria bacterium]